MENSNKDSSSSSSSQLSSVGIKCMSTLVGYPILLQHEETLMGSQMNNNHKDDNHNKNSGRAVCYYDVMAWMAYLSDIDDLLESIEENCRNISRQRKKNIAKGRRIRNEDGLVEIIIGGTSISSKADDNDYDANGNGNIPFLVSSSTGRMVRKSELHTERRLLRAARNFVSERALTLLPGSYKLWKDYLTFRSEVYMKEEEEEESKEEEEGKTQSKTDSKIESEKQSSSYSSLSKDYLIKCSDQAKKYHATVSAYERSLVRTNKYPRIWLMYATYVAQYDPSQSITTVRRLYDRALLALPATQHHLLWGDYLCYILQSIPPAGLAGGGGAHASPGGEGTIISNPTGHKSASFTMGPMVAWFLKCQGETQGQDHDHDQDQDQKQIMNIPSETVLRVLRRYALCFEPSARELLSNAALKRQRYGEAASTLVDMLNDPTFVSINGTTRHDLWMKLATICTQHPEEIQEAGVDFDAMVRAALDPLHITNGTGNGGTLGWDIFDLTGMEDDGKEDGEGNNDIDDKTEQLRKRSEKLRASLGEMEGTLWTKLAGYHVRNGEFELARSVYEEAMEKVSRVRDFSIVFDDYIRFEEGVIEALMEMMNDNIDDEEDSDNEDMNNNQDQQKKEETLEADAFSTTSSQTMVKDKNTEDLDILLGDFTLNKKKNDGEDDINADVELALARAENLTSRRPLLLNRVLLRQNPHNVGEWLKRASLFLQNVINASCNNDNGNHDQEDGTDTSSKDAINSAIGALEEAVQTVKAPKATNGSPADLYEKLSQVHEYYNHDIPAASKVYERICQPNPEYNFQDVDDLARCYASWAELNLRAEQWDEALSVARRAISRPSSYQQKIHKEDASSWNNSINTLNKSNNTKVVKTLYRSNRLWNLLLDLEESLGTVQTTRDAYNAAIELGVATPSQILNFASYLTDRKYFEEAFSAYEKGVHAFPFPHPGAKLLWKSYLLAFQNRYGGSKVARTRELFDRCLEICPPDLCCEFYLSYGTFEETYGLTKRALGVYEKMCTSIPNNIKNNEKYSSYQLYIAKTIKYLGITATRPLYERAIAALEDSDAARTCLDYARVEASLHEMERARTVYTYGAQLADPRRDPEYWKEWHDFEVANGNEETFREMLRIKRGVQAAFSTVNYNAAEMGAGAPKVDTLTDDQALQMIEEREGVKAKENETIGGFVKGKRTAEMKDLDEVERRAAKLRKVTAGLVAATQTCEDDEEEIDIDNLDEGDANEIGGTEELEEEHNDKGSKTKGVGQSTTNPSISVQGISTKAVPDAVFGSLASQIKGQ